MRAYICDFCLRPIANVNGQNSIWQGDVVDRGRVSIRIQYATAKRVSSNLAHICPECGKVLDAAFKKITKENKDEG